MIPGARESTTIGIRSTSQHTRLFYSRDLHPKLHSQHTFFSGSHFCMFHSTSVLGTQLYRIWVLFLLWDRLWSFLPFFYMHSRRHSSSVEAHTDWTCMYLVVVVAFSFGLFYFFCMGWAFQRTEIGYPRNIPPLVILPLLLNLSIYCCNFREQIGSDRLYWA